MLDASKTLSKNKTQLKILIASFNIDQELNDYKNSFKTRRECNPDVKMPIVKVTMRKVSFTNKLLCRNAIIFWRKSFDLKILQWKLKCETCDPSTAHETKQLASRKRKNRHSDSSFSLILSLGREGACH